MKNLFIFTLVLALFACKHKEESIYAGCCGAEPTTSSVLVHTQDSLGGTFNDTIIPAYIFIPNIFMVGMAKSPMAPTSMVQLTMK